MSSSKALPEIGGADVVRCSAPDYYSKNRLPPKTIGYA